jgi:hypothetical protein
MLKIRDLGINVIPVTMRPPEIGPGGAIAQIDRATPPTCGGGTETCGDSCDPSGQCVPSCDDASRAPRYRSGFTDGAVAQLRRQLRNQVTR